MARRLVSDLDGAGNKRLSASGMMKLLRRHWRFLTFMAVGGACTFIHVAVVIGLVELLAILPTVANVIAFLLANIASYLMNSFITFEKGLSLFAYFRFLALSMTLFATVVAVAGAGDIFGVNYVIPLIIAVTIVPVISFTLMRKFAFR